MGLDSSILPYLPASWTNAPNMSAAAKTAIGKVTFRMLLTHTSGFCPPGASMDTYDGLKTMVQNGPSTPGSDSYCNGGYALLRILIPYVVDGPQAYADLESNPALNDNVTSISYRNYVRGRIFDPIGLPGVDVFYTGHTGSVETIYYTSSPPKPQPDNVSVPGCAPAVPWPPSASSYHCDTTANSRVRSAASGNWTLSAAEYL